MTFLCDTTVLFAASDRAHLHHGPSLALVAGAEPSRAFVAAHTLAELYATLSAAPAPKMRRLTDVLQAVTQAAAMFTPVTLSTEDYLEVLERAAESGVRSGQIYDALILKCAERAEVETVYTWNTAHFLRVASPELVCRIRSP